MEVYRMHIMLTMGILWILQGIFALFGRCLHRMPKYCQEQTWTTMYIRSLGVSWLLLGGLWVIGALIGSGQHWLPPQWMICTILCSLPGLLHMILNDQKYRAMSRE